MLGGPIFWEMNCCHLLSWHHHSLCCSCAPPQPGVELHHPLFPTDSSFLPFHWCLCPLSVSLVAINGAFHPLLAPVTAGRGKIMKIPAGSKMVVIPKWCLSVPGRSRALRAALGTSWHQCNELLVGSGAQLTCVVTWELLQSCPCHHWHQLSGRGRDFCGSNSVFFLPMSFIPLSQSGRASETKRERGHLYPARK